MVDSPDDDAAFINNATAELLAENPTIAGSKIKCDDIGNAKRLALYEKESLRYVPATAPEKGTWRLWNETNWVPANDGQLVNLGMKIADKIQEEVQHRPDGQRDDHSKWAQRSRSAAALHNLLVVAPGLTELWAEHSIFDSNPFLFNVPNGTLDFTPGAQLFRGHVRDEMITKCCPTPYIAGARSPLLDAFLDRFIPDPEERHYIITALAITVLVGGNSLRALLMLLGPTTTGKTTLMSLISAMAGRDYVSTVNVSVFRGNLDDKPRPDILQALTTRMMLAYEASDNWELHADQVKRMTGEDPMVARGMRSNVMVEKVASFTPIIVANETPKIKGADDALRRRLRCMLMDQQVPAHEDTGEQRRALTNDPDAKAALLAMMVEHYIAAQGQFPELPLRFAMLTQQVFTELDDLSEIFTSLIMEGILVHDPMINTRQCITMSSLHKLYVARMRAHSKNNDVMGMKTFCQRLRSLGLEIKQSNGMRLVNYRQGAPFSISDLQAGL